eukprot:1158120-Pelagomonas_calceolata.AAC.7
MEPFSVPLCATTLCHQCAIPTLLQRGLKAWELGQRGSMDSSTKRPGGINKYCNKEVSWRGHLNKEAPWQEHLNKGA